jgi:hypothetical protein
VAHGTCIFLQFGGDIGISWYRYYITLRVTVVTNKIWIIYFGTFAIRQHRQLTDELFIFLHTTKSGLHTKAHSGDGKLDTYVQLRVSLKVRSA